MIALAAAWVLLLAQDLAGAPGEAQAVLGALALGATLLLAWGLSAELATRSAARRAAVPSLSDLRSASAFGRASRLRFVTAAAPTTRKRYRLP